MLDIQNPLNGFNPAEFRQRFKVLFVIVVVAMSLLVARLWYLQVVKGEELRLRSENNSVRLRKIKPLRGLIMDTGGAVLVDNQPSFDVLFMPSRNQDITDVIAKMKQLSETIVPFSTDLALLERSRPFVPIKLEKNVSWEKLAAVETHALDLPGVNVEVVPVRKYLCADMMAQVIGYTGEISREELEKDDNGFYTPGDMVGKYGIEKYLDEYVRGKSGFEQVEVNVVGKRVRVLGKIDPVSGYNVVLTLDLLLQKTAWEALGGRPGSVVVMNPRDGSVLALVSSPSFDPNLFNGGITSENWAKLSTDPYHPLENRAISGQYPPGSTYKLVVAAAAFQEGLVTPDTKFLCNGLFDLGTRTYRCWQKKGHGYISLHRAIVESCDVYFYNLGRLLGPDKIASYAHAFGFGMPTGIDLPREKNGLVPTKKWKVERFREAWQVGESISTAIGQGFNLVTPLQLANAYSTLANGGTLYRPRLIKRIETMEGAIIKKFDPEVKGKLPLSQETMEVLTRGLWGVVNERGGTGHALHRKEEDVCGKTGTAQVIGLPDDEKARRAKRIPSQFRDHALFVCFAPVRDPEIAVSVIMENAGHGGSAAAPVARKVIDAYFGRKNVPGRSKSQVALLPGSGSVRQ
ncbi:MAG: penicillin-binding protein 2 [Deltaproteobacteria bacterium]|nr:penicillin-binding protein 2 [Deltaproteobacteria bacterium]